jgi:hypothetical protein
VSYKTLIKVFGDDTYYPNGITLATREEAEAYGAYKLASWTLAENYKVVESNLEPNYAFEDGHLIHL